MTLTTVDTAVRWAMHQPSPGPVHINCQFREPLVPSTQDWPCSVLQVSCQLALAADPALHRQCMNFAVGYGQAFTGMLQ